MKRCPRCKTEYVDETLEFCLEDGNRLEIFQKNVTVAERQPVGTEKTLFMPSGIGEVETVLHTNPAQQPEEKPLPQIGNSAEKESHRLLEIAPVTIALAHNWWQWVYLENQYYSTFTTYFLSANFLMWLLLIIAGFIVSVFGLKNSRNKHFAVIGLVILCINLLLFIVPRR